MNPIEKVTRPIDEFQQRHTAAAFVYGVVKKYGDDRGGSLAGLVAYYGFLSLFPLLLLLVTIVGFVLQDDAGARERIVDSALAEFPIVGAQLEQSVDGVFTARGVGIVVGLLGLLWGGLGVTRAAQHAMAEVWSIKNFERPGFIPRMIRGLLFLVALFAGLVCSTVLSGIASFGGAGVGGAVSAVVASGIVNVGLFIACYRILTPSQVPFGDLLLGAVLAGIAWTILQSFGSFLVNHSLRNAQQLYGFFGIVLGLLTWIGLGAQLSVLGAEVNVVRSRRLWPRSIVQPPLTASDREVLADLVKKEERRPEQEVDVTFHA